jgi:predicted amidohydrolase YtcJ
MSHCARIATLTRKKSSNVMRIRYVNALLWAGDESEPKISDFDVLDGKFSSPLGASEPAQLVDLEGKFVMPAFRDGHCHPLFAGREHLGPDVTHAKSVEEIQAIVAKYAADNPSAAWIDGAAYDRSIDAKFNRSELDEAVSDRPVVLHGADHHTLWVNTRALELCGIMDAVPPLSLGSVDVDASGTPTGVLREWEAMQLVMNCIPALTIEQELDCLDWSQRVLLDAGVVEVQEAWIDPGMTEIYIESAKNDRLRVRTNLAFRVDPLTWRQDYEYFNSMRLEVERLNHPNLRVNAMKFFVDGVLGSSTASLLEPYVAGPAAHKHGEKVWDFAELILAARAADEIGLQLHMHAIGDAAVRTALDLVEHIKPSLPAVIAHTELVADDDVPRFKALNVTANFEPLWAREDGQLLSCVPQVGRERIDTMYRMRDLLDAGARLSFGSDWPVSSPIPLEGVATAVNRALPGEPGWALSQAISTSEALRAYSIGVVEQLTQKAIANWTAEGASAEFIILNANPFSLTDGELFKLRVLGTSTKTEPVLSF